MTINYLDDLDTLRIMVDHINNMESKTGFQHPQGKIMIRACNTDAESAAGNNCVVREHDQNAFYTSDDLLNDLEIVSNRHAQWLHGLDRQAMLEKIEEKLREILTDEEYALYTEYKTNPAIA